APYAQIHESPQMSREVVHMDAGTAVDVWWVLTCQQVNPHSTPRYPRRMAVVLANVRPVATKVLAIVLAGGEGKRLMPLTADRAKPAVPFGGVYRLIDFALSNLVNAGFLRIV